MDNLELCFSVASMLKVRAKLPHSPTSLRVSWWCVVLLLIGTVLNPISATLIFLPIIQALGTDAAGFHPVHLGVLTTIVLSVGLITPPYGICLLIAAQIGTQYQVRPAISATLAPNTVSVAKPMVSDNVFVRV